MKLVAESGVGKFPVEGDLISFFFFFFFFSSPSILIISYYFIRLGGVGRKERGKVVRCTRQSGSLFLREGGSQ